MASFCSTAMACPAECSGIKPELNWDEYDAQALRRGWQWRCAAHHLHSCLIQDLVSTFSYHEDVRHLAFCRESQLYNCCPLPVPAFGHGRVVLILADLRRDQLSVKVGRGAFLTGVRWLGLRRHDGRFTRHRSGIRNIIAL